MDSGTNMVSGTSTGKRKRLIIGIAVAVVAPPVVQPPAVVPVKSEPPKPGVEIKPPAPVIEAPKEIVVAKVIVPDSRRTTVVQQVIGALELLQSRIRRVAVCRARGHDVRRDQYDQL